MQIEAQRPLSQHLVLSPRELGTGTVTSLRALAALGFSPARPHPGCLKGDRKHPLQMLPLPPPGSPDIRAPVAQSSMTPQALRTVCGSWL